MLAYGVLAITKVSSEQSENMTNNQQKEQVERIEQALAKVAQLVLIDSVYLPVFCRLEKELAAMGADSDSVMRAKKIALHYKAAA